MNRGFTFLLAVLTMSSALLLGCGKAGSQGGGDTNTGSTVTMGQSDFDKHHLTVSAGTAVTFMTASSGSTHILCVGHGGSCDSSASGPSELTPGMTLQVDPGQSRSVTFAKAGTYAITCTVHPNMQLALVVT
jgi:plastocyanin